MSQRPAQPDLLAIIRDMQRQILDLQNGSASDAGEDGTVDVPTSSWLVSEDGISYFLQSDAPFAEDPSNPAAAIVQ